MGKKNIEGGVLKPGDELGEGEWLISKNKEYKMGVKDGRMVVVHNPTGEVVHSAGGQNDGVRIKFTEEYTGWFDAGRHRLELLSKESNEDSDEWVAHPGNGHMGLGANKKDNDWDDEDDQKPQRFVLTDDGNIVAVKELPPKWDGNLDVTKYDKAIWYWKTPEEIAKANLGITKKEYVEGDRHGKSPEEGSKVSDFPLEIEAPPGSSDDLKLAVDAANNQLRYLMSQMGSGDYILPKFLTTGEKDDKKKYDGTIWRGSMDDNLSDEFLKAMGKGQTSKAYKDAIAKLEQIEIQWNFDDKQLGGLTEKLGHANHRIYKKMYDRIEGLREDIWAATEKGVSVYEGPEGPDGPYGPKGPKGSKKTLYTQGGIQNPAEEVAVHKLIREAVQFCIKEVNRYADFARESGRELPDTDPRGPGYKEPTQGKKPQNKGPQNKGPQNKGPQTTTPPPTTTTPPPTTTTPPPTTTTPPPTTTTPPVTTTGPQQLQPTAQNVGDKNGTSTGTGDTSGDSSSSVGASSPVNSVPNQPVPGTGTGTGQAVTPPPNTGTGGGMDPSAMMMPAMMAMAAGQMGNQMKPPEDAGDRGDRREQETGPNSPAPGTPAPAATPAPGDPNAAPPPTQVTAPTDTGAPPPVTAPGQTVDHRLPDQSTVKVSPTVAEALNKVQANTALDAVNAYLGTSGESTPDHPWQPVTEKTALNTGDVVQWDDGQNRHSALIVKKEGVGLFFLDNGGLVPLNTGAPDSEKYGKFFGYFHPTGIETGAAPGTPPAELPPPIVTQQPPAAPPPVSPPAQV